LSTFIKRIYAILCVSIKAVGPSCNYYITRYEANSICACTEISRVRESILQQQVINREPMTLPEPSGSVVSLSEKLFIPVKEHPEV